MFVVCARGLGAADEDMANKNFTHEIKIADSACHDDEHPLCVCPDAPLRLPHKGEGRSQ